MDIQFTDFSVGSFHDVFTESYEHQRHTLAQMADEDEATRLALALGLKDGDVRHDSGTQRGVVMTALNGFIADVSPSGIELASRLAGDRMDRLCDPLAASMLLTRGINPIALMHFELMLRGYTTLNEHTILDGGGLRNFLCLLRSHPRRDIPYDYASVQLATATWWDGHALNVPKGSIPDTLLALAIGGEVGRVVEHPFVPADAIILDIEEGSEMHYITTDRVAPTCTWREAMAEAAHG